ncbi:tripartite tricarboxylate transporter permease [Neobacillus niacini]|uniref:tripartite tricarboxylate transporter permease n=1 Tax=Neobacillus niacini TaxID=86668 RepID=UPI003983523C
MIDAVFTGLSQVLSFGSLMWIVVGVLTGMTIAIIPGIGSVSMLGIMLPFTFVMEPYSAFALMIGFLAAGVTSDSIPAILLGIPGSASSQATVLDGFSMTKKGQGARALGASFFSSMIGGIFGALILSLSIPVIRPIVLLFGAPEFLLMSLWGVSMVATLTGKSLYKGLFVGGLGLLIGTIGTDPNLGFQRWTFGNSYFLNGISLTLAGIGLFAIPELISLVVGRGTVSEAPVEKKLLKGQLQGFKDAIRNWRLVFLSSGLGTIIGAIPGIGSAAVDWIAYGVTVQSSKDKSQFGKGDVRGIIGVDAANNAVYGGSLIPTIGFGIPGSTSMAFLLVVMLSHGVQVGSVMLSDVNNVSLVYFLVWGLGIANILGAAICFFGAGFLVKVTYTPFYYLSAVLIPVMFLASYYTNKSMLDIYIVIILAVIGYTFKQLSWPRAPFLIGIVLSKSIESNLNVSMSIFGFSWLTRPISLVLIALIVIGIIFSILSNRQKTDPHIDGEDKPQEQPPKSIGWRIKHNGTWFTLIMIAVTVWFAVPTISWPDQAARYPTLILALMFLVLLGQLLTELFGKQRNAGMHFDLPPDVLESPNLFRQRVFGIFAWIFGLALAAYLFGLLYVLPIFTLVYLLVVGKIRWWKSIIFAVCMAALFLGFQEMTEMFVEQGAIFSWFQ